MYIIISVITLFTPLICSQLIGLDGPVTGSVNPPVNPVIYANSPMQGQGKMISPGFMIPTINPIISWPGNNGPLQTGQILNNLGPSRSNNFVPYNAEQMGGLDIPEIVEL